MKAITVATAMSFLFPLTSRAKEEAAANPNITRARQMASQQHLYFIENKGQLTDQNKQSRNDIDLSLTDGNIAMYIGGGALHYQFSQYPAAAMSRPRPHATENVDAEPIKVQSYRMDVELAGANKSIKPILEDKAGYYENYYLPQCPKGLRAYAWRKAVYKNIYPNIDWVLYIKESQVEYEFVIRQGGKASDIKLRYKGATKLEVDETGSIKACTPMGSISEPAPYCYQQDGKKVSGKYLLKDNELSFETGKYTGVLTIDPVLKWGTYYGWTGGGDGGYSVACDPWNYVYLAGYSLSTSHIATTGTFQQNPDGVQDGMLIKFDSNGNRLWGTYYGGSAEDYCYDIAVDPFGNVFMGGMTESFDVMSSPGSHQEIYGGGYDAFVAKFDSSGNRVWGTYYGAAPADYCWALTSDNEGNIYFGGETVSQTNISTPGAYKTNLTAAASYDAFLVKLDSAGVRQWGTYYGGHDFDAILDISYDRNIGGMYVCGVTASQDSIASAGSYQPIYAGGSIDAFISKFDSTGNFLWGTYFGGPGVDSAGSLIGNEGLIYVTGQTSSTSGIASPGAYQTVYGGGANDGFLLRFNANGSLQWATYYGGSGNETVGEVCTAPGNSAIYTSGGTTSITGIATAGSYQDAYAGGMNDAYIAKFVDLNTAPALLWATYYSGTGYEPETNVCTDNLDNLYLAGTTTSTTGIATANGFKDYISGISDAFLARFRDCDPPAQPDTINGAVMLCPGQTQVYNTAIINNATSYTWVLPAGWTGSSTTNSISVTANDSSGVITVIALNGCDGSLPTSINVNLYPPVSPPINNNGGMLGTNAYNSYQWYYNGQPVNGATSQTYSAVQSGQYYVHVVNANGCEGNSDTIWVWGVGVKQLTVNSEQLSVYPNPVKDELTLSAGSGRAEEVSICDVMGRVLIQSTWNGKGETHIDMRGLASGTYMLRVTYPADPSYPRMTRVVVKE